MTRRVAGGRRGRKREGRERERGSLWERERGLRSLPPSPLLLPLPSLPLAFKASAGAQDLLPHKTPPQTHRTAAKQRRPRPPDRQGLTPSPLKKPSPPKNCLPSPSPSKKTRLSTSKAFDFVASAPGTRPSRACGQRPRAPRTPRVLGWTRTRPRRARRPPTSSLMSSSQPLPLLPSLRPRRHQRSSSSSSRSKQRPRRCRRRLPLSRSSPPGKAPRKRGPRAPRGGPKQRPDWPDLTRRRRLATAVEKKLAARGRRANERRRRGQPAGALSLALWRRRRFPSPSLRQTQKQDAHAAAPRSLPPTFTRTRTNNEQTKHPTAPPP